MNFQLRQEEDSGPFVVACEKGRFVDVKLFIKGYKRVHGADSNVYAMVTEPGKNSHGYIMPPIVAAAYNEHHDIVAYLIPKMIAKKA